MGSWLSDISFLLTLISSVRRNFPSSHDQFRAVALAMGGRPAGVHATQAALFPFVSVEVKGLGAERRRGKTLNPASPGKPASGLLCLRLLPVCPGERLTRLRSPLLSNPPGWVPGGADGRSRPTISVVSGLSSSVTFV